MLEKKSIKISNIDNVKTIKKPWGHEKWIADGAPDFKYALKEIFIRSSFQSSIQFHEFKHETTYVKAGKGILYYVEAPIDIKKFNDGKYSDEEMQELIKNMKKLEISPGTIYHIKPGIIHRVEAVEDLIFIESSTIELNDVVRINDQWSRTDGKIDSEHINMKRFRDYYREQKFRYEFAKTFAKGRTLNVSYLIKSEYSSSKILLDSVSEVWHHNSDTDNNELVIRTIENDNLIKIQKSNFNKISDKFFDTIISFEAIQYTKDPEKQINDYFDLLTNDGILIISTANKNTSSFYNSVRVTDDTKEFTKDDFLELLGRKFPDVKLYSQRLLSKKETISKSFSISKSKIALRNIAKNILLKVDKNSNFYKLHFQKTIINLRQKKKKIDSMYLQKNYGPLPFNERDNPLYFLAVCKKTSLNSKI
jgi:hypothetical protein